MLVSLSRKSLRDSMYHQNSLLSPSYLAEKEKNEKRENGDKDRETGIL